MSRKLTIWHPPTCKPENGKLIIVNEFSNLCFLSVFINDDYAPSEGYRPPFKDVKQWAYIDDILPEKPKFNVGQNIVPKNHREKPLTITSIKDGKYYSEDLVICSIEEQDQWEHASKFDAAIQEGDEVKYNEDLGCRINLSQLNRVAKKPTKKMMGKSTLGEPIDGSVDPEIQKVINENFFDMLDGEKVHCKGVGQSKESTGKLAKWLKEFNELPCDEKIRRISETRVEMEKEVWISSACKYLEENLLDYWSQLNGNNTNDFIARFKDYMKGE